MLLRDGVSGPETLLLRRPAGSRFAGGAWVFPGGVVDTEDEGDNGPRVDGLLWSAWADAGERAAAAHIRAAVREVWEETGILLGRSYASAADARDLRRRLLAAEISFPAAAELLGLSIEVGQMVYAGRWITPSSFPRRYDTRFFLAVVPSDGAVELIGGELEEAAWLHLSDALTRHGAGRLPMLAPTVATLRLVEGHATAGDALDALRRTRLPSALERGERSMTKDE